MFSAKYRSSINFSVKIWFSMVSFAVKFGFVKTLHEIQSITIVVFELTNRFSILVQIRSVRPLNCGSRHIEVFSQQYLTTSTTCLRIIKPKTFLLAIFQLLQYVLFIL